MSLKSASTILKVFTARIFKTSPILLVILAALFIRLYKISEYFLFDFDQEHVANSAFDFFINHKITLVGQELSFEGFFLGPLHDWIQFIPYGLCNLWPDCVPYFYSILGIITIVPTYFMVKKVLNPKAAILSILLYGFSSIFISYEIGVNSNFFTYLSTLALLFCTFNYFNGGNFYLILGGFVAGMATVNFNPVLIFTTLAFFISVLLRRNRNFYCFVFAILAFLINYLPLIIFNMRHNNVLGKSLMAFLKESTTSKDYAYYALFNFKKIALPFYTNYFFQNTHFILLVITVLIVIAAAYSIIKSKNKFLLFIPIWLIVVNIGFIFYNGSIPDYYFQQTLIPLILMAAIIFSSNIVLFTIFATVFLFFNLQRISQFNAPFNYQTKKQVVNYIIYSASEESFNVYFELPQGLNTGYQYLFKVNKRLPVEEGRKLYIISAGDDSYFIKYRFQKLYPQKNIKEEVVNNTIRVISMTE